MSKKLILIDGSSMLSTSFFGSLGQTKYYRVKTEEEKQVELEKLMKTSDGRYTNGVYTMWCQQLPILLDKIIQKCFSRPSSFANAHVLPNRAEVVN